MYHTHYLLNVRCNYTAHNVSCALNVYFARMLAYLSVFNNGCKRTQQLWSTACRRLYGEICFAAVRYYNLCPVHIARPDTTKLGGAIWTGHDNASLWQVITSRWRNGRVKCVISRDLVSRWHRHVHTQAKPMSVKLSVRLGVVCPCLKGRSHTRCAFPRCALLCADALLTQYTGWPEKNFPNFRMALCNRVGEMNQQKSTYVMSKHLRIHIWIFN